MGWIVLLLVVVVILFLIAAYNRLVGARNALKNGFGKSDGHPPRRYDLIPNLVETAKGYIKHERETLEAVTKARNTAQAAGQMAAQNPGDPQTMAALGASEGQLAGVLTRFMAVAEAYPDLKANQ